MRIIRQEAFARAGLIGNPSDGYNGKTISVIVKNFSAQVVLYEWPKLEIVWSEGDQSSFDSIDELAQDVRLHGYYGGIRLVKACIKGFREYCGRQGLPLHDRNFSIRYSTNIPRQVGLAGSSAIVTATMRALMTFYEVEIPPRLLPSLILNIERHELGIAAGLQDRVIQVHEGMVYMDFSKAVMEKIQDFDCGSYEELPLDKLPPLYVAYSEHVGEPTEVTHRPLRQRYDAGEPEVVNAMTRFAEITVEFRQALEAGNYDDMHRLMNENFDLRDSIMTLAPAHRQMIATARRVGASAKFAGSGGAIIGCYRDEAMFQALKAAFKEEDCLVIKPVILPLGTRRRQFRRGD